MTGILPNSKRFSVGKLRGMLTLLLLCFCTVASAQTRAVSGSVKDASGAPVIGATVVVKGTSTGATTGVDGSYKLNVPAGEQTLSFSFLGYQSQEIPVAAGQTTQDAILREANTTLDEVVVVGYGTQRRGDLTGSIASVSAKVLESQPVTSAAEAITGRLAGVKVTTAEGSPDSEIKIRVRGGGSITQDNSPLYIVDGFPVSTISDIAASDIASIDVLKDASASSIYGARGANGVIIVTTKSGKSGKVTVNFNAYAGAKHITKTLDVLDPYEYALWQYELTRGVSVSTYEKYYGTFADMELYKEINGTNWQEEVFGRTGTQQYYNLGVSGGSEKTKYNVSLSKTMEDAIMLGSDYDRSNIAFKLQSEISKKFSFDFSGRYAFTKIHGAGVSDTGTNSRLKNAIKYNPMNGLISFDPSQDDDSDSANPSIYYNPVDVTNDDYKFQERRQQVYNAAINFKPLTGLTIRSEWGTEMSNNRQDRYYGPTTSQSRNNGGGLPIAEITTLGAQRLRTANTATYDWKDFIKGHNLTFLLGQEASTYFYKQVRESSNNFSVNTTPDQAFNMMRLGDALPNVTYNSPDDNLLSFFGRVNYSGMGGKYLLTASLRADGSSKFAKGNQWGYFPSAAVAWRISDENFMQNTKEWMDNLKLRLSYGAAGNNRIADDLWKLIYTSDPVSGQMKYFVNNAYQTILNPDTSRGQSNEQLKWETTISRNVGVDAGFFHGRLNATVDAYWNTTKDLLLAVRIPSVSGYTTQMQNIGQTSNRGVEITLDGTILRGKDYSLNASFNISFNKNKIDKLAGDKSFTTSSYWYSGNRTPDADFLIQEGSQLGLIYGYEYDGMYGFDDFTWNGKAWILNDGVPNNSAVTGQTFFAPGALKFKDIDGVRDNDGNYLVTAAGDRKVIGNTNPKHTGGFSLTGTWKGFDASVFLNWSWGNDVYNANRLEFSSYAETKLYGNILNDFNSSRRFSYVNRETGEFLQNNPEALQAYNQGATMFSPAFTSVPVHSWAIEDGSFLRLNNVTIGYTLPKKLTQKIFIQNLRVYVTGYNLAIWTKYSGYDPEVDAYASNPLTPGVDYSAYPRARTIVGGVNITF